MELRVEYQKDKSKQIKVKDLRQGMVVKDTRRYSMSEAPKVLILSPEGWGNNKEYLAVLVQEYSICRHFENQVLAWTFSHGDEYVTLVDEVKKITVTIG